MKLTSFSLDLILLLTEYIEDIDTINLAHTTKLFNSDRTKFVRFNLNRKSSLEYITNNKFNIKVNRLLSKLKIQLKLNLSWFSKIIDDLVSLLGKVRALDLSFCLRITDSSVSLLGNVRILKIDFCDKITDNLISYLRETKKVNIII